MLKLYHAEPVANSLKTLINLKEKGVKAAFAMPDRTNPAFRTFTGEAR